jgi:hypothetical protein
VGNNREIHSYCRLLVGCDVASFAIKHFMFCQDTIHVSSSSSSSL